MADALVERRPTARFFCHRCNIEFEDVLQDYTCPYCASGFIEQLETEAEGVLSGDDLSDADMSNLDDVSNLDDMSNLDDSDDINQSTPPVLNDLAFFLSTGRLRAGGRRETLMEQLVWTIGGARPNAGAVTAGAPFVLVGAPGDYVFGGEGLDAVVTQLLGQLENAGPPPLPREQIAAIPMEEVSAEQAAANTSCSVCWENFVQGESISRLECDHIFHAACIGPWLQLHATCPICRRSLLPPEPEPAPQSATATATATATVTATAPATATAAATAAATATATAAAAAAATATSAALDAATPALTISDPSTTRLPRVLLRRMARWSRTEPAADGAETSSSSELSSSTNTTGGAPHDSSPSNSSTSLTSSERDRTADRNDMDVDFE